MARKTTTKPLIHAPTVPETSSIAVEEAPEDERKRAEEELEREIKELSELPDASPVQDPPDPPPGAGGEPKPPPGPPPVTPTPPTDDTEDPSVAAKAIAKGVRKLPHPPTKQPSPKKFFEYWAMLGEHKKYVERTICYVYRKFPSINKYHCPQCYAPVDPPKNKSNQQCVCDACGWKGQIFLYIDKYAEPFPMEEVIYRLGVGTYRFRLNDWTLRETLAETIIETPREWSDWESYRPILDVKELDMADPINATYIKKLRSWGDLPKEEGAEDMAGAGAAAAGAIETLVGAVERSNEKMADMAEKISAKNNADKPAPAPDLSASAGKVAMDIISQGVTMANGMVADAQKRATDLLAQKGNPMEQVRETVKLIADIMPKPAATGTDPQMEILLKRMETQDARMAIIEADRVKAAEARALAAEERLRKLEDELRNPKTPPTPAKTFGEQLKELVGLKDILAEALGIDTDKEDKKTDDNMPPIGKRTIVDYIPVIMQAGMGIMHMHATARYNEAIATGHSSAQPIAPPAPPVVAPDALKAYQDLSTAAGGGAASGAVPGAPFDFIQNLPAMTNPVLDSLKLPDDEHPGYIFAEKFIAWAGRIAYDAQREKGKTDLLQIFRGYHPIWSVMSQIPIKAEKFIDEFLAHDAILKEIESEDDDDDDTGNGSGNDED